LTALALRTKIGLRRASGRSPPRALNQGLKYFVKLEWVRTTLNTNERFPKKRRSPLPKGHLAEEPLLNF
jgi:hypothetical protein